APARGAALHDKLRADLIARIPVGIWLAMAFVLALSEIICLGGTLVAGPLLRRHERTAAVVLPYLEVAGPGALLIFAAFGVVLTLSLGKFILRGGHMVAAVCLVLALTGVVRRWPWQVRLLFQAGWMLALVGLAIQKARG